MIQPNLPIPLAFSYLSHFLLLLFLSSSRLAPRLPSPPLSLLYPCAISASLYVALFPLLLYLCLCLPRCFCLHFTLSLHILFFIAPYLSDAGRGEGRGLGSWEGCDAARRDWRWHHGRKPCTCPFDSDHSNSHFFSQFKRLHIFLSIVVQTWAMTQCGHVSINLYVHVGSTTTLSLSDLEEQPLHIWIDLEMYCLCTPCFL